MDIKCKLTCICLFLCSLFSRGLNAQAAPPETVPTSVDARLVLDAAGPEQRKSLGNIYLIACPLGGRYEIGTGFATDIGVVVTNAHVTATCDETNLFGLDSASQKITFSKVIKDQKRDLALLVPTKRLTGGLKLAAKENAEPGTAVSTWGYPFYYNGVSPLLSVGYISGYRVVTNDGLGVKHIIVNGAFNHGNSGGPLLVSQHDEVIGIVVSTTSFYPPEVKAMIDGLSSQRSGVRVGSIRQPDGSQQSVSEAQVTGIVLNEFYEKTQVFIGEAIAVSELRSMIQENKAAMPSPSNK
jgi:hypothetical protein